MKSRNLIMLALVAATVIGAWQVSQRKAPTTESAAVMLYPGLIDHVNDARQVAIAAQDGTVTVVRNGELWRVTELDGYPAEVATVKRALLQLASLKILETKTSKPEKYAQIGVEDRDAGGTASRAVKVMGGDDQVIVDLLLGKERPARAMNAPGHYVRRAGETRAYLVEGELELPAKPAEWVDTSIVNLPVDRVRQVTIQPTGGEVIIVNKARPDVQLYTLANIPAGQEVRARATVSSMGGLLLDARFDQVVKAAKVAGVTPRATAVVETFDGLTATVTRYDVEGTPYLTLQFAHTPEKAVEPPPPAPNEAPAPEMATPAPEPVPLKKPEEVAREVAELNARVTGWAYVLPDYKSRLLEKQLADLLKKQEPKAAPGGTPAK